LLEPGTFNERQRDEKWFHNYYNSAREGGDWCALHLCARRNLYRIDSAHSGNSRVKARSTARPLLKPHAGSLCLPRVDFTQLANAFDREWLVTNGLGGFACGTVALANTRRYHGLLVASLSPPVQRVLMLAKLDVTVRYRGITFELGCNEFADGTVTSRGFELLSITLRTGGDSAELELLPLCTYRDYHWHAPGGRAPEVSLEERGCRLTAYSGARPYRLLIEGGDFDASPEWYWSFHHRAEEARGLDVRDLARSRTASRAGVTRFSGG
jgi:hypothetical protein